VTAGRAAGSAKKSAASCTANGAPEFSHGPEPAADQ